MRPLDPEKYLYGAGSLSLVWQLGSGSVKFSSSGRNLRGHILNADLRALCNKILSLSKIPRPISHQNGAHKINLDQQEFNIKQTSFLMLGLYVIYKVQAEDLKRKLLQLFDQCRRRHTQNEETSAIDLPRVDINRQEKINLDINQVHQIVDESFGELFMEFGFGEPASPRTRFQDTPIRHASPALEQVSEVGEPSDVMSILRKTKKDQKAQRRLKKQNKDNAANLESDTALLTLLKTNHVTDPREITMIEVNIPQDYPNMEDVRFDDDFASKNFNNQSTMQGVDAEGMLSPRQPNEQTEPSFELLPRHHSEQTPQRPPQMPDSFRLDQIIRVNELERTPDEGPVVEPSRKRRRTKRFYDDEVKLTTEQLQENLATGVPTNQQIREMLNDQRAPRSKLNINFPLNIRPVQFTDRLCTFHGRELKAQVLHEMVNQIQNDQLHLDAEVRRQNVEDSNNGDFTTFVPNVAMEDVTKLGDIDMSNIINVQRRNRISEVPEIPLQETTTGGENPEATPYDNGAELQNDNINITVIQSPPREPHNEENFPIQSPFQDNNGQNLDFAQMNLAEDGRLFSDMFPPASTTKSQAAFQFNRFLKLQKKKKVIMTQENFFGPMHIKILNPTV